MEIVSPSNTAAEIQEKILEYLAAGTRLAWVVDPETESVTVYRSREDVRLLTIGDALEGGNSSPELSRKGVTVTHRDYTIRGHQTYPRGSVPATETLSQSRRSVR